MHEDWTSGISVLKISFVNKPPYKPSSLSYWQSCQPKAVRLNGIVRCRVSIFDPMNSLSYGGISQANSGQSDSGEHTEHAPHSRDCSMPRISTTFMHSGIPRALKAPATSWVAFWRISARSASRNLPSTRVFLWKKSSPGNNTNVRPTLTRQIPTEWVVVLPTCWWK